MVVLSSTHRAFKSDLPSIASNVSLFGDFILVKDLETHFPVSIFILVKDLETHIPVSIFILVKDLETHIPVSMASHKLRNRFYAGALAVMAGGFAVFPLVIQHFQNGNNLTTQVKPLSGHQTMRGAYINTGSRDAGPDPDWDMRTGTYKGKNTFNPSEEDVAQARRELAERLLKEGTKGKA